jgi:hypothetical protein
VRSALLAILAVVLLAAPALAQQPSPTATPSANPSIAKAPPSWTFYMAIATIAIAVLTLILALLGYLMQSPGFRRTQRGGQAAGDSGPASS